jgi:hypothetical protein
MNLMHKAMKRFILTESQLIEYVENKKSEKIYYDILEQIHRNRKYLNEVVSHKKANQSVIDKFMSKKLINQRVAEMLIKHKIVDETGKII